MNPYLYVSFRFIFEIWEFFKSIFFDWRSVVLVVVILIVFIFKNQIRLLITNPSIRTKDLNRNQSAAIFPKKQYYSENSLFQKLPNWVAILISFWVLVFSIYSYNQMLIKDEPRVAFAEPNLILTDDNNYKLSYTLINIGGTETDNVKIKLSTCEESKCPYVLFNDELLNVLDPGIPHKFGFSEFSCNTETNCVDRIKTSPLIIVDLEYSNPLKNDPSARRFYYYWSEDAGLISVLKEDICSKANKYRIDSEIRKYLTFCQ